MFQNCHWHNSVLEGFKSSKRTKWVLCFGGSVWSVLCLASMVENPCERSVGARGGNQAVRTRGGNNRREQEAGRSLRNAAFRAEPKKLCINTTLSINDKTVYKHVFSRVAQHRPKTKPCINTVFLSVDVVLHGKNNVYTRFFRWETKLCLYIVFSAPPEMRHCSSLRAPFLMYSLLFPHVTAVAVLCVRIAGGCGTTWRPKPKSNTNKKSRV